MKYETPKLTGLMPAISAIESSNGKLGSQSDNTVNPPEQNDTIGAYADWE